MDTRYTYDFGLQKWCPSLVERTRCVLHLQTMEPWYMESVWWVFKTLFEKGLVYQGYKVCWLGVKNSCASVYAWFMSLVVFLFHFL
jgi:hypothetical protein